MRSLSVLLAMLFLSAAYLRAQTPSKFEVGPVARVGKIHIEGGGGGTAAVAGLAAGARWNR